ncbi:MAG: ribosomal-protein-alanine N-acetyltransferase, partial [Bifidobacterium animalis]|nr:ribosomal-protein-alanine N-acetyltransferase [Bifidobacterium animalis]
EPALTLYRHFGFETMGIRKRYYQPENKDAYTMSLTLRDHRPAGFAIPSNTQC